MSRLSTYRLAAVCWLVAVGGGAQAQSPPDPDFAREQLFASYQEFKDRLSAISSVSDAAERMAQLNSLWDQLESARQVPFVHGGQVAFLYRGSAESVAWPGDFNGWDPRDKASQGVRVPNTDVWILEKSFEPDARLDYKIVIDDAIWVLDPLNVLRVWGGFGPNSELRMPGYRFPQEAVRREGVARGGLTENIKKRSTNLGYDVNYRVYTPAGYDGRQLRNLPVVYATDGHEYASEHLGSLTVVLDNLIASGAIQPTMAVFVDSRDPATSANRRADEYRENPKFVAFLADELVPEIDAAYRTQPSPEGRTILGASLGGLNAAYVGAMRTDVFRNVAIQSPASFEQFAPKTLEQYSARPLRDKLRIYITAGTIGDGAAGAEFAQVLEAGDYDFHFLEVHEGHSWGSWRALLDDMLIELVGPAPR